MSTKEFDMTQFEMDQLEELVFAESNGVDTSIFADPRYTADRMEAIIGYLMEGYGPEGLAFMLDDASVSDTQAWNLLNSMLDGKSLEDILLEADEKEL